MTEFFSFGSSPRTTGSQPLVLPPSSPVLTTSSFLSLPPPDPPRHAPGGHWPFCSSLAATVPVPSGLAQTPGPLSSPARPPSSLILGPMKSPAGTVPSPRADATPVLCPLTPGHRVALRVITELASTGQGKEHGRLEFKSQPCCLIAVLPWTPGYSVSPRLGHLTSTHRMMRPPWPGSSENAVTDREALRERAALWWLWARRMPPSPSTLFPVTLLLSLSPSADNFNVYCARQGHQMCAPWVFSPPPRVREEGRLRSGLAASLAIGLFMLPGSSPPGCPHLWSLASASTEATPAEAAAAHRPDPTPQLSPQSSPSLGSIFAFCKFSLPALRHLLFLHSPLPFHQSPFPGS